MPTIGSLEVEIAANIARLTKDVKAVRKQFKAFGRDAKKTGDSLARITKIVGGYVAFRTILRGVQESWDLAFGAARFQQAEKGFENLAASFQVNSGELIASLRKVSAETISTADLMKSAGTAMLLGIPADRLADMMGIARASARITGQTMQQAFEDIAKGVGRQSRLILDNLGIIVSAAEASRNYAEAMGIVGRELTQTEQKQAFLNEVMNKGQVIIESVGVKGLTSAEQMAQLGAKLADLAIIIGERLIPIVGPFVEILSNLIPAREIQDGLTRIRDLRLELMTLELVAIGLNKELARGDSIRTNTKLLTENAERVEILKNQIKELTESYTAVFVATEKENVELQKQIELVALMAETQAGLGEGQQFAIQEFDLQEEGRRADERVRIVRDAEMTIRQLRMDTVNHAVGFLAILGQKSKVAAIAAIALEKGLAIAQVIMNTQVAMMKARAVLGPGAGDIAAGRIALLGAASVGLIAATGLTQAASIGGGGTGDGGGGGVETTNGVPTNIAPQRGQNITINVHTLDPSSVNWENIVSDNIAPAMERIDNLVLNVEVGERQ